MKTKTFIECKNTKCRLKDKIINKAYIACHVSTTLWELKSWQISGSRCPSSLSPVIGITRAATIKQQNQPVSLKISRHGRFITTSVSQH